MYRSYYKDKFRNQTRNNTSGDSNLTVISTNPQLQRQQKAIHKKFVNMIILIFGGYSITCLPSFIYRILFHIHLADNGIFLLGTDAMLAEIILRLLLCSNSLVNIIVFSAMDANFQKFMMGIFYYLLCRKQ